MANSGSGESIIARFVRILSAFDDRHQTMSVAELGRRTGLPVTTAYRIVNELLLERLLEREPGGDIISAPECGNWCPAGRRWWA